MSAAEAKLVKGAVAHNLGVPVAPDAVRRVQLPLPLLAFGVTSALLSPFLFDLVKFSVSSSTFSYILLIPLIIAALLYRRRKSLRGEPDVLLGAFLLVVSLALGCFAISPTTNSSTSLSLKACSVAFGWLGVFALSFGRRAILVSIFPLSLLVFLGPIPSGLLSEVILFLQVGTAWMTEWLFRLFGIPVLREGISLALPTVDIVVDPQCSGIRSSLVLLLADLVLGYLYLKEPWRRILLVLAVVPVVIMKNSVRIFSLTALAMYVDPSFLTGHMHHEGGILFFILGFSMLASCVGLLRRSERRGAMAAI